MGELHTESFIFAYPLALTKREAEDNMDDYDANEFQVRVSPELFETLAGRGRRTASGVTSGTADGSAAGLDSIGAERLGLKRATGALDSKLSSAHIRMAETAADLPCANARADVVRCFRSAGSQGLEASQACKAQVESFTACARRVSAMKEDK